VGVGLGDAVALIREVVPGVERQAAAVTEVAARGCVLVAADRDWGAFATFVGGAAEGAGRADGARVRGDEQDGGADGTRAYGITPPVPVRLMGERRTGSPGTGERFRSQWDGEAGNVAGTRSGSGGSRIICRLEESVGVDRVFTLEDSQAEVERLASTNFRHPLRD
jgi:hypothetical protein